MYNRAIDSECTKGVPSCVFENSMSLTSITESGGDEAETKTLQRPLQPRKRKRGAKDTGSYVFRIHIFSNMVTL